MTHQPHLELVDPTSEAPESTARPAPRPSSLAGGTIGLLSNGKTGTAKLFDHLERMLRDEWGVAEVVRRTKAHYSAPAEDTLMDEAATWSALFAGVGD
ncbi:MAG: hypothetical protein OEY23_12695 [Acidimicrobiia bacterium]|nr:hypothetical protein [Acidimicrobiia bacterium]